MGFLIMSNFPKELEDEVDIFIWIINKITSRNFLRQDNIEFEPHHYTRTKQAVNRCTPPSPVTNSNEPGFVKPPDNEKNKIIKECSEEKDIDLPESAASNLEKILDNDPL
ncbi:hypothetical protein AYI68_g1531 [Smittium mucronatum]|uniref:Uncharacterized protein n=1 Tax=Smittium mucronatum TaxID=133383 RepID=A0A1R0H5B9_9FUNG|nr:hypothetical protein AYI68_g1531 [Smittium mucronatum]